MYLVAPSPRHPFIPPAPDKVHSPLARITPIPYLDPQPYIQVISDTHVFSIYIDLGIFPFACILLSYFTSFVPHNNNLYYLFIMDLYAYRFLLASTILLINIRLLAIQPTIELLKLQGKTQ